MWVAKELHVCIKLVQNVSSGRLVDVLTLHFFEHEHLGRIFELATNRHSKSRALALIHNSHRATLIFFVDVTTIEGWHRVLACILFCVWLFIFQQLWFFRIDITSISDKDPLEFVKAKSAIIVCVPARKPVSYMAGL